MALTYSTMLELGAQAPDFALPSVTDGSVVRRDDVFREGGALVMFICAHCPFVIHVQQELARLGRDYADKPVGIVAISANDASNRPQDAPENLARQARDQGFGFPYLFDEPQDTAKAYHAACTPDLFLFDGEKKLVYRGQLDESRPSNDKPVTGADLRAALDALLAGQPIPQDQKPSAGCNIKWKAGNEPE